MTRAKANLTRGGDLAPADSATASTYTAHYFVDGDETLDPSELVAGKDYAIGDAFEAIARRFAQQAADSQFLHGRFEQVECLILCDCCGSDLASATAYRWS